MKTITLISFLIMLSLAVFSGGSNQTSDNSIDKDPQFVLEQLKQFYTSHEYIHHQLRYTLYPDHSSTIPHSIESGVFIKAGNKQYTQLASIESIINDEYAIGIDHDEKIVMISNLIRIPATDPMAQVDQIAASESEIRINILSPTLSELQMYSAVGEIQEARLIYDVTNFQPVKLVFFYRKQLHMSVDEDSEIATPRLEVEYTQTDFEGREKSKLELSNYIMHRGDEWRLAPEYNNYELLNNIHPYPDQN